MAGRRDKAVTSTCVLLESPSRETDMKGFRIAGATVGALCVLTVGVRIDRGST